MTMSAQNELEVSMINACKNQENSTNFYENLLKSDIYFLPYTYQRPPVFGEQPLDTSSLMNISIQQIEFEGKVYTPFFSSVKRIEAVVSTDRTYYKVAALDFFKIIKNSPDLKPLILNPGSDYAKLFTVNEVEVLADGRKPVPYETVVASKGDQILLGQPSIYPHELIKTLISSFKKNKNIKQAFLALMHNQSTDEYPHNLIVIDVKDDFYSVADAIGRLISRIKDIPNQPIDITQFLDDPNDPISSYCRETVPFYRRTKFLGIF